MANPCRLCTDHRRTEIEKEYLQGQSARQISIKYEIREGIIRNHCMKHLPKKMVKAFERQEQMQTMDMMTEFTTMVSDLKSMITEYKNKKLDGLTLKTYRTLISLYGVMSSFASVYFQNQQSQREFDADQAEQETEEAFSKKLSILTDRELALFEKLNEKIQNQDKNMLVLDDGTIILKRLNRPARKQSE